MQHVQQKCLLSNRYGVMWACFYIPSLWYVQQLFQLEAQNAFATKSAITLFSLQLKVSSNPLQSIHKVFA